MANTWLAADAGANLKIELIAVSVVDGGTVSAHGKTVTDVIAGSVVLYPVVARIYGAAVGSPAMQSVNGRIYSKSGPDLRKGKATM